MRALIDDLLAYTTARDAVLSPAHCDLNSLVADIAAGRRDHAQSTGKAIPVFRFSELCAVDGDPVLVRQLMENLIGNAIKYTAPGVIPTITITTRADTPEPGMTRVEVTDNGIGIPTSQHAAVFGNFHRAHLDADYTGTGLGLAICKRIVERHGGTITASDNSTGQGTRITFTLPSASLPFHRTPRQAPAPTGRIHRSSEPTDGLHTHGRHPHRPALIRWGQIQAHRSSAGLVGGDCVRRVQPGHICRVGVGGPVVDERRNARGESLRCLCPAGRRGRNPGRHLPVLDTVVDQLRRGDRRIRRTPMEGKVVDPEPDARCPQRPLA
jgi:hypothetical protein